MFLSVPVNTGIKLVTQNYCHSPKFSIRTSRARVWTNILMPKLRPPKPRLHLSPSLRGRDGHSLVRPRRKKLPTPKRRKKKTYCKWHWKGFGGVRGKGQADRRRRYQGGRRQHQQRRSTACRRGPTRIQASGRLPRTTAHRVCIGPERALAFGPFFKNIYFSVVLVSKFSKRIPVHFSGTD